MPKRKVEGPPFTEPKAEVLDSELNTIEDSTSLAVETTPDFPVGEAQLGGATGSHLDPLQSEVDRNTDDAGHPFWALLALAGYETW